MMADQKYGVLSNVVLAYAKLAEPSTKYQSTDLEYSVDCVVDKATAKAWSKQFTKQKAKEYDKEEFESKFKMDAPFDGDEVYVIKMKKAATKNGEAFDEKYRPKVLLDTKAGDRLDITTSRLISNGSKAQVSYRITENDFGIFGQLNNVLMNESGFIEYVSSGGIAGGEFGDTKEITKEPSRESATSARSAKRDPINEPEHPSEKVHSPSKPVKKAVKQPDFSDMDDDIPFN